MEEVDYIYCLKESESGTKFYIGRTIDPIRRIYEHELAAIHYKEGDEWVYEYASTLNDLEIKWEMELLMTCGPRTEFYEDYFVCKYRHEPLQNMRAGDSEPWMNRDHKSPEDFVVDRSQSIAAIKARREAAKLAKKERIKRDSDPERMLFSFEKPETKFVSKHLSDRIAQRKLDKDIDAMEKAGFFGRKVDKKR